MIGKISVQASHTSLKTSREDILSMVEIASLTSLSVVRVIMSPRTVARQNCCITGKLRHRGGRIR